MSSTLLSFRQPPALADPAGAAAHAPPRPDVPPDISVIVPVRNEAGNIRPLIEEIHAAMAGRWRFEVVYVDDGSTDQTGRELRDALAAFPALRVIRHAEGCGQSAALRSGVLAARGRLVVTLDGDGQNDPADIGNVLEPLAVPTAPRDLAMVAGQRRHRRDSQVKRLSSRVANGVRARLLGDRTPDTGCGLKAFRRDVFLLLPYFDHQHRFLPALIRREGYTARLVGVGHRPRRSGTSKYGIWNRLWVGIVDLLGVYWLMQRRRRPSAIREEPRD